MVFFLYAVSILLIAGGGAGALFGADMIRTETGSTLAVAGVAMTCAGLLLFALTACLVELRRIRRLAEAGEGHHPALQAPFPVAPPVVPPAPVVMPAAMVPPPAAAPVSPLPPAPLVAPAAAAIAAAADAFRDEGIPMPAETGDGVAASPAGAAEPADTTAEWDPARPARDPAGPVERPDTGLPEPAQPKTPAATADDSPPPAAPAAPEERRMVATYTSGENTYFMYSDGAIEADTPRGRFRFGSMDELRGFVETGEGGMPLAPPAPPAP